MVKLNTLTHEIIDQAYCIDVEMRQVDTDPAMMGLAYGNDFKQVVFDQKLSAAAKYRDLEVVDLHSYLDDIVSLAKKSDSVLIAYSTHEQDLLCELLPNKADDISSIYCNANLRKWMKRNFPDQYAEAKEKERRRLVATKQRRPVKVGLKQLLKMPVVQYAEVSSAGIGSPAKALQYVRTHSDPLTVGAKRKWSSMLTYNRHDVIGMRHLLHFMVDHK
jgi:hypothetical protein